jgi:hypothetical protein
MTNEEKLLKLLQVAVENGWEDKKDLLNNFESIVDNIYLYVDDIDFVGTLHSLNDLITNWEESEISFIESLCKNQTWKYLNWKEQRKLWDTFEDGEPRPTSERLDWLFDTFKHLL